MYRCMCGAEFNKPVVQREIAFCVDGFPNNLCILKCPCCGLEDSYFSWMEDEENDYI